VWLNEEVLLLALCGLEFPRCVVVVVWLKERGTKGSGK